MKCLLQEGAEAAAEIVSMRCGAEPVYRQVTDKARRRQFIDRREGRGRSRSARTAAEILRSLEMLICSEAWRKLSQTFIGRSVRERHRRFECERRTQRARF